MFSNSYFQIFKEIQGDFANCLCIVTIDLLFNLLKQFRDENTFPLSKIKRFHLEPENVNLLVQTLYSGQNQSCSQLKLKLLDFFLYHFGNQYYFEIFNEFSLLEVTLNCLKDEKLFISAMKLLKKMEEEHQQLTAFLNIENSLLLRILPRSLVHTWYTIDNREVAEFQQSFFLTDDENGVPGWSHQLRERMFARLQKWFALREENWYGYLRKELPIEEMRNYQGVTQMFIEPGEEFRFDMEL